MSTFEEVRSIIGQSLQLGERVQSLTERSRLLGGIPEFDSMAVVGLITALEEHFGFTVHDDEVSGDTFETVGSLSAFVERKLQL